LANLLARYPKGNVPAVAKSHMVKVLLKLFQKVSESYIANNSQPAELLILKNTAFVLAALNFEVDTKLFENEVKRVNMLSVIMKQTKQFKNKDDVVRFLLIILCNLATYPDYFAQPDGDGNAEKDEEAEEDENVKDKEPPISAGDVVSLCLEIMESMMSKSQPVVNECLRLLMKYLMTIPNCIRAFCDKNGCGHVVNAMRTFLSPSITLKAAHIIHSLHNIRAASVAFSRSGTVSVLLNNMVTFINDQNCVKACCNALCGLSAQQQDVENLIQFAAVDFANEPLSSASLNAISMLASEGPDNTALLLKCGVIASIALLLTGTQSVKVADAVCRAVASLAGHGDKPSVLLLTLKPALQNIGKRLGAAVAKSAQLALDVMDRNSDPGSKSCLEKGFCTGTLAVGTSLGWTSICTTCSTQHMTTMERDCAVCDNCKKHCPENHVFSARIFGPRGCECCAHTCREIGVSITGSYKSPKPVMIPFGAFCTDDVLKALAKADPDFASVMNTHSGSSIKVEFIDKDNTACDFYGLDCVPIHFGEILQLRITF